MQDGFPSTLAPYSNTMSNNISTSEECVLCPFRRDHVVYRTSLPYHTVSCKEKSKAIDVEKCEYNTLHYVKKGSLPQHYQHCPDALALKNTNPELQQKMMEYVRRDNIKKDIENLKPEPLSSFLDDVDNSTKESQKSREAQQEPAFVDLNASNFLHPDPEKNTLCRMCRSPIDFISLECVICALVHPQGLSMEQKPLLFLPNPNNPSKKENSGMKVEYNKVKKQKSGNYHPYQRNYSTDTHNTTDNNNGSTAFNHTTDNVL